MAQAAGEPDPEKQRDLLDELLVQPLETVRAYTLAQQFDSFYELPDPDTAEEYLRRWIVEVNASSLGPLIKFARMLKESLARGDPLASQPRSRTGCSRVSTR